MAKLNENITNKLKQESKKKELFEVLSFKPIKEKDLELVEYTEMEFDTIKEKKEHELLGWSDKQFYRVKGISGIVKNEKQKPNSYVTYLDCVAEEIVPEYISVMIKKNSENNTIMEVLASQILNYFGVPTVLNIPVKCKNGKLKLMSVDSISTNEIFTTFLDYGLGVYTFNAGVFDGLERLTKLNNEDKEKIISDYILTYLVRSCVLADFDFESYNVGLLNNKSTNNWKLVNFDLESTFWTTDLDYYGKLQIERFYKSHPEIINKFREKLNDLFQVFDDAIENSKGKIKEILTDLRHNIQQVLAYLNKMWAGNETKNKTM